MQLSGKSKVNAAYGRIVLLLYWQQYNAILILFIQHYYTLFIHVFGERVFQRKILGLQCK
jgi:hypothetical protein